MSRSRLKIVRLPSGPRGLLWLTAPFLLGLAAYAFWPRDAHLRVFDPARVARLETRMWRSYYEERYAALLVDLYALNREEYGFSPTDSLAIALYAAQAARTFQPTRSRAEAQSALPLLERYYAVLRRRGGETFDTRAAARLELNWWQLRRENAPPPAYGAVIAQTMSEVFHADNAAVRRAGMLRAQMMSYRDERRDGSMQEADWAHVESELVRSYEALRAGVTER